MKAIVANVLFGSIVGCLGCANSAQAHPKSINQASVRSLDSHGAKSPPPRGIIDFKGVNVRLTHIADRPNLRLHPLDISQISNISAKLVAQPILLNIPQIFGLVDHIFTNSSSDSLHKSSIISGKQPYIHHAEQINLVLGFQPTFWSSANQNKYWGVTAVEQWGKSNYQTLDLPQLNYVDSAPVLAEGNSTLTFSGGGDHNLAKPTTLNQDLEHSPDFENFRGGVTYHHGIARELTMGVGFIYEDYFAGFTQLTYDSDILPVKTTFSVIAKENVVDLSSHVVFQPTSNFKVNYYGDQEKQKFDLNWSLGSEFTLIANGNTKTDSYNTGIKIAVKNDFLSFSASAALDQQSNWQWNLNTHIGGLTVAFDSNNQKSSSELSTKLFKVENLDLECSAFVKHQIQTAKEEQKDFMTWGAKLNSKSKINPDNNLWSLELGYGSGFHGQGVNIGGSISLKPNLTLKLDYQEISAVSDESKIKLQLGSP